MSDKVITYAIKGTLCGINRVLEEYGTFTHKCFAKDFIKTTPILDDNFNYCRPIKLKPTPINPNSEVRRDEV